MDIVTSSYEHQLAYCYHQIDKRGLLINKDKLHELRKDVILQRKTLLEELSQLWNCHVYLGRENDEGKVDSINLNTPAKVLEKLKKLGFTIPKVRFKDVETGDIEFKDSVNELALRRCFAEETDPNHSRALKIILDVRELNTLYVRYINAKLHDYVFYSNYNVCGTLTGRRSCRKNPFGLGGNAQNFPKHYTIGKRFIECITSRPGKIFFIVDQMQAEDWPVSALSENHKALQQLREGFDRHTDLASFIFGIPKSSRTTKEWKDSLERYLGKKTRHANNYGMKGQTMSDALAKEGFNIAKATCDEMLKKVNEYDQQVDSIFHNYIKRAIFNKKFLRTPLGRERFFLGLRPNDANHKILMEAFSYIPQSIVGDNTGFAVLSLFNSNPANGIVAEAHDSITQEINDKESDIIQCFENTGKAFDREVTFHNGITIKIPIEAEIGYNLRQTIKLRDYSIKGLQDAYQSLQEKRTKEATVMAN